MARQRECTEGLKYLRPIWQSSYTSQRIHIIMMSMVVKLIVNLKHLQKETIDTFFTSYQNNMMKKILLTFLLFNFTHNNKKWVVTYYKMTKTSIWTLKKRKSHLVHFRDDLVD